MKRIYLVLLLVFAVFFSNVSGLSANENSSAGQDIETQETDGSKADENKTEDTEPPTVVPDTTEEGDQTDEGEKSNELGSLNSFQPMKVVDENLVTGFSMILIDHDGVQTTIESGDVHDVNLDDMSSILINFELIKPDELTINAGDTYELDLPSFFSGNVMGQPISVDGTEIATYSIIDGKVIITFNEHADRFDDTKMYINLSGSFDTEVFEEVEEVEVDVPFRDGTSFTKTIRPLSIPHEGEDKKTAGFQYILDGDDKKEVTRNPEYIDWTVLANDSMESIGSAKIIDSLGDNLEIVEGSIKVYRIIRNYLNKEIDREEVAVHTDKITYVASGFELDLGDIDDAYEVSYTTKITRPEGGGTHTINNKARIVLDGTSNDVSDGFTGTWSGDLPIITKSGTSTSDPHILDWEIKYNYGKENLGTVNLSDALSHGVVDLTTVEVYTVDVDVEGNKSNLQEVVVTPALDENGTLTIPNLDANGKAYYITYSSSVPVGLDAKVVNTITDNLTPPNSASDSVDVNTIPTGGKVGEQKVDDDGRPYIEWTITLNSTKVDVGSITVRDVFNPEYLEFNVTNSNLYDLYKVHGEEKEEVNNFSIENYTHTDDRTGFKLNITDAGPHTYEFVYKTYYTVKGMQEPLLANEAELVFLDGNGDGIGEGQTVTKDLIGPKAGIRKNGWYITNEDRDQQEIEWRIDLNQSKILLNANSTITETFTSGNFKYIAGSLFIEDQDDKPLVLDTDYSLEVNADGKGFVVTLLKATNKQLTMFFKTTADDTNNLDHTNDVTLKWQGGEEPATKTVEKRDPGINKSGEVIINDDGTKSVKWTVNFNTSKHVIHSFVLTDSYTPTTVTVSDIKITTGETNVTNQFVISDERTGGTFTVSKDKLDAKEYQLTYYTTLSAAEEQEEIKNTAAITYTGGDDSVEKIVPSPTLGVSKQANNIDRTGNNPVINWTIYANTDSDNKFVNLVDAVLEDTIPEDQKLVSGSVRAVRVDDETKVVSSDRITTTDNSFTINLPDGPYQYKVTFQTEILQMPSLDGTVFDRYNNSVELTNQTNNNDLKQSDDDNAWIRYYQGRDNDLTAKTGCQNVDTENVDYDVTINPEGLTIHNAKIKDTLSTNHTYVEGSIKLFNAAGDKVTTGFNLIVAENKQSFEINFVTDENTDGTINSKYTIKYSTRLNAHLIGTYQVTNSIILTGGTENTELNRTETSTSAQQWFYGGGGEGQTVKLEVNKFNNKVEEPGVIEGVVFKLERVNLNNTKTVIDAEIKTNENGIFVREGIRAGRYILTEISTPGLYQKLEKPIYFVIGYTKLEDQRVVDGVVVNPYTIDITNENWQSANNDDATATDGVLTIVNKYKPVSYTPIATKTLIGLNLDADEFEFVLKDSNGHEVGRATNDSEGLVTFSELTFTQPGKYTYTMSEIDNGRTGMTYDDSERNVTVTIDEGENGLVVTSVNYENGTVETGNNFVNQYKPIPTSLTLTANKDLSGRDQVADEFSFEVYKVVDGKVVGDAIATGTNNAAGDVTFTSINYTAAGTHDYVMVEVKGDIDTVDYDDTKIFFTVTVTDNDGQLKTAVLIKDDATFEFNNSYTPKPTSLELQVSKLLEASKHPELGGRKLQENEFKFNLYSVTDEGEVPVQTEVGNNEDGSIPFEDLNFTAVGTYNYRIREEVDTDSTIIYDTIAIDLTVVVEDDEGQLVATATYKLGDTTLDEAVFTNTEKTYAIGDYTWIDAHKDGIQDADEEVLEGVIVELYDDAGNKLDETTTDEFGLYIFDELVAGTYKVRFVLTEQQAALYEFTQQVDGDNSTDNSDANPITGWTVEIVLNDDNEHLTKDYDDQEVLATQGIDPTWDAGVILRERTEVSVLKEWVGLAEESVEVTLYRQLEGSDVKDALHVVELNDDNDWTHTWENLYVDIVTEDGKVNYIYTVEEAELDRYLTEITGDATNGFVITNTRKTYAIGDYTWIDTNKDGIQDEDELNLEGVIVELYDEKGNKLDETTTDEFGRYLFDELEAGTYRVKFTLTPDQKALYEFTSQNAGDDKTEDSDADVLTGWTVDIVLNDENEYLSSNEDYEFDDVKATMGIDPTWDAGVVLRARTTVTVSKVWVGGPTEKPDVEVVLLRNGAPLGDPVTLNDVNEWTHTWENLYVTDEAREAYVYTVAEVSTEGYLVDITGDADRGFVVTNTRKTYAIGDYTWIDTNKDGIQDEDEPVLPGVIVELYDEKGNKLAETTTDEKGRYLFDDLEAGSYRVKFTLTPAQRELYEFTSPNAGDDTTEDSDADVLTGWTKVIVLNEDNEYLTSNEDYEHGTVKATMGVDPTWDAGVVLRDLAQLTVQKVWKNAPKVKPSIKVQLYRNGEAYGDPVTLNGKETTPWSHTWTNLYVTDENRELYVYTVDEIEVPEDYKKSVDGFVITNTYEGGELPKTGVNSRLWTLLGGSGVLMAGAYLLIKGTKREED